MSIRRLRQLLWMLAAAFVVAGSGIMAWRWTTTTELNASAGTRLPTEHRTVSKHGLVPTMDLAAMRPLWNRQYQQPLYDPPPTPSKAPVRQSPPLRLKLLGTVIEPGNTQAILMKSDGSIEFKQVGEQIDDATIEMIDSMQVVVQYHGEPHTLQVQSD